MSNLKLIVFPIVASLLLLFFQFRLILRHIESTSAEFENLMLNRVDHIGNELENYYYCYRSEAQQLVPKNRAFYLLHPNMDEESNLTAYDTNRLDTIVSHSSLEDYSFSTYRFNTETKINLRFDFEFTPVNPDTTNKSINPYEEYVLKIYRNYILSEDGERLVDSTLLDSLITKSIRSIEGGENCVYRIYHNDQVIYQKGNIDQDHMLLGKDVVLYRSRLMPDLRLELGFKNTQWSLAANHRSFYLATLALGALILFLFIRNYQSIKKVKKVNQLKSEFINLMTHEFNTPVTNLSLAVENFDANLPKQKLDKLMTIVSFETDRIKKNIQTLFQINKLSANELELDMGIHSLHDLMRLTTEVFEITFQERGVTVLWNLNAELDVVKCDKIHLLNVLTNIIDNSLKYVKDQPKIEIITSIEDHQIKLTIRDHGIGMTKAQASRAFEKYYRSEDLFVQSNTGMGLGLFYSKKIIELHNGTIQIQSELNQWTEVIIKLPISKSHDSR